MTPLDPDDIAAVLSSLRAGVSLDAALRAMRVTPSRWQEARDADATLAEQEREAAEEGTPARAWAQDEEVGALLAAAQKTATPEATRGGCVNPGPMQDTPTTTAPATQARVAWATVAQVSAALPSPVANDGAAPTITIPTTPAEDLALLIAEAARYAPGDFGFVLLVDAKCIAAGMSPMSSWWRWSVGNFYATGKPWGIFLVGRGGGKSTTLERVAAAVARYGARNVPPGQEWTWPFISVGPDDANRRINGIAAVFKADGMPIVGEWDESGTRQKEGVKIARAPRGSLELLDARGNSIRLASVAGTIGNLSGPSTFGLTIDEAAKLIDARGANPLTEIVTSAAQTSRGRANWRAIMSSSAFDRAGIHFQMVENGDTDVNFVARIGAPFLDHAVAGFESVAAWEQRRGDTVAARTIREHAASLRADSPLVPTWTAFPGFGNPSGDGSTWDGAALATRMLVEVLPEKALGGVPRIAFWLRECGSLPMDRGDGFDPMSQLEGLAEWNAALAATYRGEPMGARPTGGDVAPMKLPGARPGDARYDGRGAASGGPWRPPSWEREDIF